jgi:hypothetical protein
MLDNLTVSKLAPYYTIAGLARKKNVSDAVVQMAVTRGTIKTTTTLCGKVLIPRKAGEAWQPSDRAAPRDA